LTAAYTALTAAGVPTRQAASLTGLVRSTAIRRGKAAAALTVVVSTTPPPDPVNKLTILERAGILAVLTSDRFVDLAPLQIYAQLLDEGVYLCSVSTMYRVLRENRQVGERRRLARHPAKVCPELVASASRQVYSWDITKLAGPIKGQYFDAYVMIDIYSRYIVGVHVHTHESGVLATELMKEIFGVHARPAGRARRSGHIDDQQDRRSAARRPRGHPVAFPAEGVKRQPLFRGAVQNLEIRAGIP
jgi:putative transposase